MQGDEASREQLRKLAHGPCKRSCQIFAKLSHKEYLANITESVERAREDATVRFYADQRLAKLDDDAHQKAVMQFEEKLEQSLQMRTDEFGKQLQQYTLGNFKRCMSGCVQVRETTAVEAFCECIDTSSGFATAAQCFAGIRAGGGWSPPNTYQ